MVHRESVKYRKGLALSAISTSRARCFYWVMRKLGDIAEWNIPRALYSRLQNLWNGPGHRALTEINNGIRYKSNIMAISIRFIKGTSIAVDCIGFLKFAYLVSTYLSWYTIQSLYIFRRNVKIIFKAVEFLFCVARLPFSLSPNINLDKKKKLKVIQNKFTSEFYTEQKILAAPE